MKNIILSGIVFSCITTSNAQPKQVHTFIRSNIVTAIASNTEDSQTASSVWNEYKANPFNHPNIPNNSYAGYRTGVVPLPNPAVTPIDVTDAPYNAIPNDTLNDQPAIQAAIDDAGDAGGGIVYLPSGKYCLYKPLYIKYNNVIVRGQGSSGSTATILDFKFSMYSMYKKDIDASGKRTWLWWSTGLVWIGPGDTFKQNGAPDMINDFEDWRFTSTLATVTQPSDPGSFSIIADNTALLSAGMKVLLCYKMPTDRSLIKHIYGHAPTASGIDSNRYVGDCSNIISPSAPFYYWPALIQNIEGNTITFDRPLRTKVDPSEWPVTIRNIGPIVTESGIENLQIKGHNTRKMAHLATPTSTAIPNGTTLGGWNGVYINRSWNCWVNNVEFVNLECGVILAAAKNCSALNTMITSTSSDRWYHHPYAFRRFSSDNLIEDFTIDGPGSVTHGISVDWYTSGNVYSKGLMKVGTFDTHRGIPFDLIRTEITVANDAHSIQGGATTSGPYAGKRVAHWNNIQKIQPGYQYENSISRKGDNVYEPLQYPMGAFVAITGPIDNSKGEYVPAALAGGDLGTKVVTGPVTDSDLVNLYHAQLALRKSTLLAPSVKITKPANNTIYTAPARFKLIADASDPDGTIDKVEFYNGATLLHTEYVFPYGYFVVDLPAGSYILFAKATDNNGNVTISEAIRISVLPNIAPTVKITNPADGAGYIAPATIQLTADAKDADGTIKKVDFYNGSTLLFTENFLPYSSAWLNVPEGTYSVTAKATDNNGKTTTSAPVGISVTAAAKSMVTGDKLNSFNGLLGLNVNPNPVAKTLNISIEGLQTNHKSGISVLSVSGVVIKTIQSNALNKNVHLDVSSLSAGVYFIKLINGDKILYKQFVKL